MSAASRSVLIVTRTFPPDPAAVGQLIAELAAEFAARGWRVGIATTTPNPREAEPIPAVEVKRVAPWFAFSRESTLERALSYFSIFPALLRAAWVVARNVGYHRHDQRSPSAGLAWSDPAGRREGPRCAVVAGSLSGAGRGTRVLAPRGVLAGFFRALSNWGLRRSDLVIVPGRCMAARLRERGLAAESIHVVPNWSAPSLVASMDPAQNPFRHAHGIDDAQLVVMYSGNFGLAHGFDAILAAAERLKTSRPDIVFLMVGDGPRAEAVREDATRRALANMRFLPLQPREGLAESLGAADVHLITMRERLAGLVVPSKFYGALAAGRPCLFIGPADSEIALTIDESGCGLVVGEADVEALVAGIIRWADDRPARAEAGARALALARNFSVAASADKLLAAWQMTGAGGGERV